MTAKTQRVLNHGRRPIATKLHSYSDTDSLYIDLAEKPGVDSVAIRPGVVLDLDADCHVVGIDLDQASRWVELPTDGERVVPFLRVFEGQR